MSAMKNLIFLDENEYIDSQNSNLGNIPQNRPISDHIRYGFINLDKPGGPTSHEVVSIVKNILGIKKAGHSGTLDPHVTGVLPIGLLSSTKILSTLLHAPKIYICNMHSNNIISQNSFLKVSNYFTGPIYQVPPLKSNVVKQLRIRKIYEINFIDQKEKDILFSVKSQAGTYIRTLCKDMGRATGSPSYMKELRRIQTGPFKEDTLITLHSLFDAWEEFQETGEEKSLRNSIYPVEKAVSHLSAVIIRENAINAICHGIDLKVPGILAFQKFAVNEPIAIYSPKGELIGIGLALQSSEYLLKNGNGNIIHPSKIIMERNVYK